MSVRWNRLRHFFEMHFDRMTDFLLDRSYDFDKALKDLLHPPVGLCNSCGEMRAELLCDACGDTMCVDCTGLSVGEIDYCKKCWEEKHEDRLDLEDA